MINRKWLRVLPLAVMLFIVFSPQAYGDFYWKYFVVSGGDSDSLPKDLPKAVREQMQNQLKPATETQRCYLTPYGFRAEQLEDILIIKYDTMTMYQLNPLEKTYTKANMLDEIEGSMGQMAKEMAEESQMTPTDETMEIAGYNCRKYIFTMMGAESEHWLSKEVEGYEEYKAIGEKMLKKHPELGQMGMAGYTGEEGFPVKTVNKMMGITVTTTLQKFEKRSLNKNLFEVPAGYKLMEMKMPMQ